jgi:NAD(P) transhydrogenase subunit alpha
MSEDERMTAPFFNAKAQRQQRRKEGRSLHAAVIRLKSILCGLCESLRLRVKSARLTIGIAAGFRRQFTGMIVALSLASPAFAQPEAAHPATTESSTDLPTMLFVFMLATFIGLGVVTRVSRLLHTPLMSITNAISAIAVVGAIAVAGDAKHSFFINLLGAIALFASTTNIVSGFLITDRMLKMFKRQ